MSRPVHSILCQKILNTVLIMMNRRSCAAVGYFRLVTNLRMTLRSIVRDLRESFGNLSRRNFEAKISSVPGLSGHLGGKSLESSDELLQDDLVAIQHSSWAGLPPELLRDVMKRLEQDDSNWPSRKDVVACASVCTTWREMCKDIVRNPEFCGKLTFPVSLKQVMSEFLSSICMLLEFYETLFG